MFLFTMNILDKDTAVLFTRHTLYMQNDVKYTANAVVSLLCCFYAMLTAKFCVNIDSTNTLQRVLSYCY